MTLIIIFALVIMSSCHLFFRSTLYDKHLKRIQFISADEDGNYLIVYDSVRYHIEKDLHISRRELVSSYNKKISYKSNTYTIRNEYLDLDINVGKYFFYNNKILYWISSEYVFDEEVQPGDSGYYNIKKHFIKYRILDSLIIDTLNISFETPVEDFGKIFYNWKNPDSIYFLKDNPVLIKNDPIINEYINTKTHYKTLSYDYKKILSYNHNTGEIEYFYQNKWLPLSNISNEVDIISLPKTNVIETDYYSDAHNINLKLVYWFKDNKKYLIDLGNHFRVGNIESGKIINIPVNEDIFYVYIISNNKFLYAYRIDEPEQVKHYSRIGIATIDLEGVFE